MKMNDEIRLGIAEIAERFGLSLVVLFGSVAAGADPFFLKKIAERCEFVYEESGKGSLSECFPA
jgi:hypothetical protein